MEALDNEKTMQSSQQNRNPKLGKPKVETPSEYLRLQKCPICHEKVRQSDYLKEVFDDEKVLWLANLVTHYRHEHIVSWNKCWEYGGGRYRANWFSDYDTEKSKVNERAKRQLIRKGKEVFREVGIKSEHFKRLMGTTNETLEVAKKQLDAFFLPKI